MCREGGGWEKSERSTEKRRRQIPLIDTRLFAHMHAHRSPMTVASGERAHKQREYDAREKRCRQGRNKDTLSPVQSTCSLPPLIQCQTCFPGCSTSYVVRLTAVERNTHHLCLVTQAGSASPGTTATTNCRGRGGGTAPGAVRNRC